MKISKSKFLFAVLMTAALSFMVSCGDSDGTSSNSNNSNNSGNSNNGSTPKTKADSEAKLKELAAASQDSAALTAEYIRDTILDCPKLIDEILSGSPFPVDSVDYKKLKISLLLNCIHSLKTKNQLSYDLTTIYLWKLPKSMSSYVKVLIKEFYTKFKNELIDCYASSAADERILERLIANPEGDFVDYDD